MRTPSLLAIALVLLLVVPSSGALAGPSPSQPVSGHDGFGTNYTATLRGAHAPNTTGVTVIHAAATGSWFDGTASPRGIEDLDIVGFYSTDFDASDCVREDVQPFGVDRGNDDRGTTVDEDLRPLVSEFGAGPNGTLFEFTDDRDLAGRAPPLNASDQFVARHRGCYRTPRSPGWYRFRFAFSGTGYNGSQIDSLGSRPVHSHYVYVCECRSRSEAESVLGPPPSEGGGDRTTPTVTGTATPAPTRSPTPTSTGVPRLTDTEMVTVGEIPNSTASPTASSSPTASPSRTASPSPPSTPTTEWRRALAGVPVVTQIGGACILIGLVLFGVGRLVWE